MFWVVDHKRRRDDCSIMIVVIDVAKYLDCIGREIRVHSYV